jgi:Amt family ammonium transporter
MEISMNIPSLRIAARTALLGTLALGALGTIAAFAQEAAAPASEAAPPIPDKGDTAWMLLSTILVVMMTIPGLALFYGGLVRAKNMLSVLMQVLAGFSIMALLWVVYGYSFAFGGDGSGAFFGGLDKLFLAGVTPESTAATFSEGVVIPELAFVAFQLTFAGITPALIVGAIAERMKFGSVMLFLVLWFTFSYLPMAHMVWAGGGLLFEMGALDFAGGTVVHINAGIAGLVAAIIVGPRIGFLKDNMAPHNLTFAFIGACLLWIGWFGFNAGSNLEANGLTAQALLNTITATAAAALSWSVGEKMLRGHASQLGAISGAIAGLVAITPAAGLAGTVGAIFLGAVAGVVCLWAVVSLKVMLKYDDSLDVFGVHGVGGIVGALGTAIVAAPSLGGFGPGGEEYGIGGQMGTQFTAVVIAIIWSGVVSAVALYVVKATMGLRLAEAEEREGLDITSHGERAYN